MTESNDSKKSNKPSDSFAEFLARLAETSTGPSGRKWVNRQKDNEIPKFLSRLLTKEQQTSLDLLELFGWRLWFVRRDSGKRPRIMLQHEASGVYALLTDDGNLDMEPEFPLRPE
jgi:hypothetical protein